MNCFVTLNVSRLTIHEFPQIDRLNRLNRLALIIVFYRYIRCCVSSRNTKST